MRNLLNTIFTFMFQPFLLMLRCNKGVVYNGDNYAAQWVTKPSSKLPKGEVSGKKRIVVERKTLVDAAGTAGLDVGDTIKGPYVPPSCLITDAYLVIDKSLGATGIFDLGYLATADDAADADAFVKSADAGGQAVLQRANVNNVGAGLLKRTTQPTQIVATCTEVMDDTVLDAEITMVVEYVSE